MQYKTILLNNLGLHSACIYKFYKIEYAIDEPVGF